MAAVGAIELGKKKRTVARRAADPTFSADQVVHATDMVRHWKDSVEPRLSEKEFLVMFSHRTPKVVLLDFKKFTALWRKAQELEDKLLEIEATERILRAHASGKPLTSLKELAEMAGFTQEDLENLPDVELIPE